MSFLLFLSLAIALISSDIYAQTTERQGTFGLASVLRYGGVADELDMTEQQQYDLDDLWLSIEDELFEAQRSLRSAVGGEDDPAILKRAQEAFRKALREIEEKQSKQISEVLVPQQIERLKQIRFQLLQRSPQGLDVLSQELELSGQQQEEFEALKSKSKQQAQEILRQMRSGNVSRKEAEQAVKKIRDDLNAGMINILNEQQREELEEMAGEAFEFQVADPNQSEPSEANEPNESGEAESQTDESPKGDRENEAG